MNMTKPEELQAYFMKRRGNYSEIEKAKKNELAGMKFLKAGNLLRKQP